jgi:F-type H+-transporting ATPase subunit epsilon
MELQLEIVTPSRRVVQAGCREVYAPGVRGEFGILPEHAPLVSLLGPGRVRYREGNEWKRLAIRSGFAQVSGKEVMLLADEAVLPEEAKPAELKARRGEVEAGLVSAEVTPEEREALTDELAWIDAQIGLTA